MSISCCYGCCQYLDFYELDHMKMEYVEQIHKLGSKSLFRRRLNSAVADTTGWGAGNHVCVLEAEFLNKSLSIKWQQTNNSSGGLGCPSLGTIFLVFPDESCDISCLGDEFGM